MHGLRALAVAGFGLLLGSAAAGPASAGTIPTTCDPASCGWAINVSGFGTVASGGLAIDDEGNITPLGTPSWSGLGGDITASVGSLSGNVDPEVVFGVSATNATNGAVSYSFSFFLPLVAFPTPISTYAELGTTLTSPTGGVASVFVTSGVGKIVDSQDIRFSPSENVDKGVDVGVGKTGLLGTTALFFESASGSILVGGPFDFMSVIVSFGLIDPAGTAAAASVGMTGKVVQTALVPEPSTVLLLGAGLAALALGSRRRDS